MTSIRFSHGALAALTLAAFLACGGGHHDDNASATPPTAQAPWTMPGQVGQSSGYAQQAPVLVSNGSGSAMLVWIDVGTENRGSATHPDHILRVLASVYQGDHWGSPTLLSEELGFAPAYPTSAAMDAQGNVLLIGNRMQWYDATSKQWSPATVPFPRWAQVRFAADGTAIALWSSLDRNIPGANQVLASRMSAGTWSAPVTLYQSPTGVLETLEGLDLAVNAQGHALAAWNIERHTYAARFDASAWETPTTLDTYSLLDQVALDDQDHGMVVFESHDPATNAFGPKSAYVDAAGWKPSLFLTPGHESWGYTQVAPDGAGGFWAAWSAHVPQSTITQPVVAHFSAGVWGDPTPFDALANGHLLQQLIVDPTSHYPMVLWTNSGNTLLTAEWLGSAWGSPKAMGTSSSTLSKGQVLYLSPGVVLGTFQADTPNVSSSIWSNRYH
jgi:hypothetical protein